MSPANGGAAGLMAGLLDFALGELVRQRRESFPPLWPPESWAKLMIRLVLNSGCSGDREALEAVGLGDRVVEPGHWQLLEDVVAVPWRRNP